MTLLQKYDQRILWDKSIIIDRISIWPYVSCRNENQSDIRARLNQIKQGQTVKIPESGLKLDEDAENKKDDINNTIFLKRAGIYTESKIRITS